MGVRGYYLIVHPQITVYLILLIFYPFLILCITLFYLWFLCIAFNEHIKKIFVNPFCLMPTFCMKFLLAFSLKNVCVVIFFLQVTFYHLLKLFQTESALASGKKQLVSEFYDEVVSRTCVFGYVFFFQLDQAFWWLNVLIHVFL